MDNITNTVKKIDLFGLNYSLSSKKINYCDKIPKSRKLTPGILFGIIRFIFSLINSAIKRIGTKSDVDLAAVVFFAGSLNQNNAVYPIYYKCEDASIIGTGGFGEFQLNIFISRILSIRYITTLIKIYRKTQGYKKKSLKYLFDRYLSTYGFYLYMLRFFKKHSHIKVLVLANDHTMRCRVLNETAQLMGIKTIYIQHASVNEHFPPLAFDYACLDGNEASSTYKTLKNTKTKIFVTGNANIENNLLKYSDKKDHLIGLCFNPIDEKDIILETIIRLKEEFGNENIYVRPHPNDRKFKYFKKYCKNNSIKFSSAKKQNIFEYFQNLDLLIAGESNIHLEAVASNIPTIYFRLGRYKNEDWYGFIKKGLIRYIATNMTELIEKITIIKNTEEIQVDNLVSGFYQNTVSGNRSSIDDIISVINLAKKNERTDVESNA